MVSVGIYLFNLKTVSDIMAHPVPYFLAHFIQRHGMISAQMIYGRPKLSCMVEDLSFVTVVISQTSCDAFLFFLFQRP